MVSADCGPPETLTILIERDKGHRDTGADFVYGPQQVQLGRVTMQEKRTGIWS
jgi:hypothetical protein